MQPASNRNASDRVTLHVTFSTAEHVRLLHYATGMQVAMTTLIRAIVRERLERADARGYLRLEIPDVEVPA